MESCTPEADIVTSNGSFNAATNSTPANTPRDGCSTKRRGGSIHSYIQGVKATLHEFVRQVIGSLKSISLLENIHASISDNTGSGETTTDVVNPNLTTIFPENEGEMGEAEIDMQDLIEQYRVAEQALFELQENLRASLRARAPLLIINKHKYEATNSTSLESKEHCCICLDEYIDGEEIVRIDCGHLYHVGCIREWNKLKKNCPICKRRVYVHSYGSMRIHAVLDRLAGHLSSDLLVLTKLKRVERNLINKEPFSN